MSNTKYFLTMSNKLVGSVTNEIRPSQSTYSPVVYELVQFLKLHPEMQQISYAFEDKVSGGTTVVTIAMRVSQ